MGVPAVCPWVRPVPSLGLSSPTWKASGLPESPSSPSSTLVCEPGRGAPVRAQPGCGGALPAQRQACGQEDRELGKSWPGQKKEGGGARKAE